MLLLLLALVCKSLAAWSTVGNNALTTTKATTAPIKIPINEKATLRLRLPFLAFLLKSIAFHTIQLYFIISSWFLYAFRIALAKAFSLFIAAIFSCIEMAAIVIHMFSMYTMVSPKRNHENIIYIA